VNAALLGDRDWNQVLKGNAPVRLYLDGLDEVANHRDRERIVASARELSASHPTWQILLTTRDYIHADWLCGLPNPTPASKRNAIVWVGRYRQERVCLLREAIVQVVRIPGMKS
jgi:hypothetical protein